MLNQRQAGPSLARIALAISLAVKVFAAVTPYFPNNRLPGETTAYVAGTLVYYVACLVYLSASKRVAAIFG